MRRQPCFRPKLWPVRLARRQAVDARGDAAGGGKGPQATMEAARRASGISAADLWSSYAALGGREPAETVRRFLQGRAALLAAEYDLLADALVDEGRRRDMALTPPDGTRPGRETGDHHD